MTCFHPLKGIYYLDKSTGERKFTCKSKEKRYVRANHYDYQLDKEQYIPCGQCLGCRLSKSREWAIRCVCELTRHSVASFVTLTFDPLYLPKNRSVSKDFIRKWFKKFRESVRDTFGKRIRFYCCGEYGSKLGRPHYHAIIFGFDFPDKTLWGRKNGQLLYVSEYLKKRWIYGFHTIGQVTMDSCQYVAQYVAKKFTNKDPFLVDKYYNKREPEFHHMSRRPGIGGDWFEEFFADVYPNDRIVHQGKTMKPPKYFDYLLEKLHPEIFCEVKRIREENYAKSDMALLPEKELFKELKRKEEYLHNLFKKHHRYLDEGDLANA